MIFRVTCHKLIEIQRLIMKKMIILINYDLWG